jgi:glycosyltransferase involved in cell wall biosynthesis
MNTPQEHIFDPAKLLLANGTSQTKPGEFQLMFHGLLAHRHGLDTAIQAVNLLRERIPGLRLHIYGGETPYMEEMLDLVRALKLDSMIHYHGHRPLSEIARTLADMDVGIIPNRRTPFTEVNMPTRIFENLALKKPVIVPDTKGIRDYFGDSEIFYFDPDDSQSLADRIRWIHEHPVETAQIVERGHAVYQEHVWSREKRHLLDCVARLLGK